MKAISPIISIIMVITLSIIVAGAGAAVFFSITQDSSDEANQSAKHFIHDKTINLRIESATSNSLKIRNLGTSSVNYDEIYILDSNNNEINFSGQGNIETKSTKVLEFSTALEKGSYKLVTPLIDVPFKVEEGSTGDMMQDAVGDMMQDVIEEPDPGFASNCGTELEPCQIYNATQLNSIRDHDLNFHYILMSDIDLSGFNDDGNPQNGNWIPVGKSTMINFQGTLDGKGHVISGIDIKEVGLTIGLNEYHTGFFGYIGSSGTVKNTGFEGVVSNGGVIGMGGIAGVNAGKIENSYMDGDVTGEGTVGGLAGVNQGTIKNSYATGNVSGDSSIGGLVGSNNGTCTRSYWDKTEISTTSSCGAGRTSDQFEQGTAGSTINSEQIFTGWSNVIWDFGTSSEYPKLKIVNI